MEIQIYSIFVFSRNIVLKYIRYSYFSKMCLANIFIFGPKFDIQGTLSLASKLLEARKKNNVVEKAMDIGRHL